MTVVYCSYSKLNSYIKSLQKWFDHAWDGRGELLGANDLAWDPCGISDDLAIGGSLANQIWKMKSIADELRTRRDSVKAVNDSGVPLYNASGEKVEGYYLPDGASDNPENVKKHNADALTKAKSDAAVVKDAMGGSSEGDSETIAATVEGAADMQDNPLYSKAFINGVGVDRYLEIPARIEAARGDHSRPSADQYSAHVQTPSSSVEADMAILGNMLAAGSRVGGTYKNSRGAEADLEEHIYRSVTDKAHYGRITGLNGLLTATTSEYDPDFLVELADDLEDVPYDPSDPSTAAYKVPVYHGGSPDPLAGVFTAMGNNPDAAVKYLTCPDSGGGVIHDEAHPVNDYWDPNQESRERMQKIRGHDWTTPKSMEALTALFAGASAKRVDDPDNTDDVDERAAWAIGEGIDIISGYDLPKFTTAAKNNTACILENSMYEVDNKITDMSDPGHPDTFDARSGPARIHGVSDGDIKKLISVAASDDQSLQRLARGVGRHSAWRTKVTIDNYPDVAFIGTTSTDTQEGRFTNELSTGGFQDGQIIGYIADQAESQRRGKDGSASETLAGTMLTGLGEGMSMIPNPYTQTAGLAVKLATPAGTEYFNDEAEASQQQIDAVQSIEDLKKQTQHAMARSRYTQLSNSGRLSASAYNEAGGSARDDYAWMDWGASTATGEDGYPQIDLEMIESNEQYKAEFKNWLGSGSIPNNLIDPVVGQAADDGAANAGGKVH